MKWWLASFSISGHESTLVIYPMNSEWDCFFSQTFSKTPLLSFFSSTSSFHLSSSLGEKNQATLKERSQNWVFPRSNNETKKRNSLPLKICWMEDAISSSQQSQWLGLISKKLPVGYPVWGLLNRSIVGDTALLEWIKKGEEDSVAASCAFHIPCSWTETPLLSHIGPEVGYTDKIQIPVSMLRTASLIKILI